MVRVSKSVSHTHRERKNGESNGPGGEEHKGNEPTEFGGEDIEVKDLPEHLLERAVLWVDGGDAG